ncbi:MAG: hypothetical protein R2715_08185 [Ilumatobacteraceae bacterium]
MVRCFEPPVYCYHEIVHNKLVVDRFERQGVVFVDDIEDVPPGSPIMLSAHGSAPEVVAAARAKGSYVVDSVCPLVTKVHHEVKVRANKGYRIVYVGHEGHEEAVGTMAVAPQAIHRVESVVGVEALPAFDEPVALPPQTTLSHRIGRASPRPPSNASPTCGVRAAATCAFRHHEPPIGADGDGAWLRRRRRDRLANSSNTWPWRSWHAAAATTSTGSTTE